MDKLEKQVNDLTWQVAIAEFRKAIDLNPKDAFAHTNLGLALYAKKDLDEAIAVFRKAIDLDPNYAYAAHRPRPGPGRQEDLDGAIAESGRAIDLNPEDALAAPTSTWPWPPRRTWTGHRRIRRQGQEGRRDRPRRDSQG